MSETRRRIGSSAASSRIRQTIVETVEAPRLEGITITGFVKFKHDRAMYERRIEEKNSGPKVEVQMTTYIDSVDPSVLNIFPFG